jgi:hypothetical protein
MKTPDGLFPIPRLCFVLSALALAALGPRTSRADVVCPVCKSCSYTFTVGGITITESMSGKGNAQVHDFQGPRVPRTQIWTSFSMEGTTPDGGTVRASLDPSRTSVGMIESVVLAEFPARNRIEFFLLLEVDSPILGSMTLASSEPLVLTGIIPSIPPTAAYSLEAPVDFYTSTDPLKTPVGTLSASTVMVTPGSAPDPVFARGDANADGGLDLGDPVFILNWQFRGGPTPTCLDAADSNDDERNDLSDAIWTLRFLFSGGSPPPPPYPGCGLDPTSPPLLDCAAFPAC